MQSEQINELVTALAKANAVIENATMNKENTHFKNKYADLASICDAVRKPLAAQGLIATQTTEIRDSGLALVTILAHSSGQWIKSEYPLPATGSPQQLGSALTYARRYSLSAIAGIAADEDDDAEAAEKDKQKINTAGMAKKIAPKIAPPPVEPPSDPQTGEVLPHEIDWPGDNSPVTWGGKYIAAIKTAADLTDLAEWEQANDGILKMVKEKYPRAYRSVDAAKQIILKGLTEILVEAAQ